MLGKSQWLIVESKKGKTRGKEVILAANQHGKYMIQTVSHGIPTEEKKFTSLKKAYTYYNNTSQKKKMRRL